MKVSAFIHRLAEQDRMRDAYVFTKQQIRALFPEESEKALEKSLGRMVAEKVVQRMARGIYLNPLAAARNSYAIEEVAKALRPGEFNYVSLESILSEYGVISQVPLDRITVMTTGSSGVIETPLGVIEFTHTKRRKEELMQRTLVDPRRPLPIATKKAAVEDLRRVGRNTNMLIQEELEDLEAA